MSESEVALEYFWTSSHVLQATISSDYLFYISETPEYLLKIKIDFLPSISLQSFQSHCVALECRDIHILHPFHLGWNVHVHIEILDFLLSIDVTTSQYVSGM